MLNSGNEYMSVSLVKGSSFFAVKGKLSVQIMKSQLFKTYFIGNWTTMIQVQLY